MQQWWIQYSQPFTELPGYGGRRKEVILKTSVTENNKNKKTLWCYRIGPEGLLTQGCVTGRASRRKRYQSRILKDVQVLAMKMVEEREEYCRERRAHAQRHQESHARHNRSCRALKNLWRLGFILRTKGPTEGFKHISDMNRKVILHLEFFSYWYSSLNVLQMGMTVTGCTVFLWEYSVGIIM